MSGQRSDVLVVTKARFAEIDMERIAALRTRSVGVLSSVPGFISTSVYERHDDPFAFMALGHFASEEDSLRAWDAMVRSPVMEVLGDLMTEPLNSNRFRVRSGSGVGPDQVAIGKFCSVSTRIADPGFGGALINELDGIFAELRVLPGFLGHLTGQMCEMDEEILGLAFWSDPRAFAASIPKKTMYRIDLFCRVL